VEAGRKGYSVPDGLTGGMSREIRSKALGWRPGPERNDALIQAYRLYVLALAGTPELGAMNRLREHQQMPSAARWRLAAAYQLAGQPDAATQVASGTSRTVETYREWGYTFGSALRDQALILEALSLMDRRTDAVDLMQTVSQQLGSRDWLSTQETAFSLIAVARYLEGVPVSERMEADFQYGGEEGTASTSLPLTGIPLDPETGAALTVNNTGSGAVYGRLIVSGTPLEGESEPSSNALRLQVRYLNLNGEEVDPSVMQQGADMVIETRVTNPGLRGRYSEMALTQILPTGWEIHNTRMDAVAFSDVTSTPQYQDIRDDRVLTYFGLAPNETKIFRLLVNASYAGRYYLPSVSAYAMYDESVYARAGGKWVEVTGVE
jgi:alpha-2-macroglobulin